MSCIQLKFYKNRTCEIFLITVKTYKNKKTRNRLCTKSSQWIIDFRLLVL